MFRVRNFSRAASRAFFQRFWFTLQLMSDSEFKQTCNTLQNQIDNARDKLQKIQYMDDRMILTILVFCQLL
jgi:hypothetical protein